MPGSLSATCVRLAWVAALLMGLASWAGVFTESVYAKEAPSWATQGVGQDIANLFVALPVMLVSTLVSARGSRRAALVLLGVLLYVVYSYTLYAFFVHFGPWFPVYVAALGCAFYALVSGLTPFIRDDLSRWFGPRAPVRSGSAFLMLFGVTFAILWLGDIGAALAAGRLPKSVEDARLPVNPVHVIDLALVLPGMIVTSALLWRRRPTGFLFAVPLLVFSATMGTAVIAMIGMMYVSEMAVAAGMIVVMGTVTLVSLVLVAAFLRHVHQAA